MSDQNQPSTEKSVLSETGQTSDAGNAHSSEQLSEGKRRRLANLEAHKFKKGQSGNPGGRSKKQPVTEALEQIFEDRAFILEAFRGVIAGKSAVAKVMLLEKAADRLEGKLVTPVDVSGSLDIGGILEKWRNNE